MAETLTGILFAVWFITAYFLSVKFRARMGCVRGNLFSDAKLQRKFSERALTGDELSRHHARRRLHTGRKD